KDFVHHAENMLATLDSIAAEKNKIPALTEFGYNGSPDSTWWTTTFLKAIESRKIAYALAWRNAGINEEGKYDFYVPYKGQLSAADFIKFYNSDKTLFQRDVAKEKLYQ
ncbi:MAG TPA: beta-mannosidase, partial [Chitinophagaceae bacterium]